jgi:hypothetical protein
MVKVKERGRTKAPETSNLVSDTRAAEPVPPDEQETAEQEINAAYMLAFLKGSGLTRAKLAWPLRDPIQRFNHLYLAALELCSEGHALMWEAFGAATSIPDATSRAESIKTVAAHLLPVMVEDGLRAAADPKARGSEGHACFRKTQSELVARLLGEAPATNSPVENSQETSHKKLVLDRPNTGDAALEQRQSEFVRLAKEIGLATAGKLIVEAASPDERAHIASMAACVREVTSPEPPAPVAAKPAPFAEALEAMTLKDRRAALIQHYGLLPDKKGKYALPEEKKWETVRGKNPAPEKFRAWLNEVFPDRREIGMVLSDLEHLDSRAYEKVMRWSDKNSKLDKAVIDGFDLPTRITKYDPERDAAAPKSWAEVHDRAASGEDSFENLKRSFERAAPHFSAANGPSP